MLITQQRKSPTSSTIRPEGWGRSGNTSTSREAYTWDRKYTNINIKINKPILTGNGLEHIMGHDLRVQVGLIDKIKRKYYIGTEV